MQVNIAASQMYGYSQKELLQMKNSDLSAEPDATREVTETSSVIKDNIVLIPVRYHKKKNGSVFIVEITGRFFKLEEEEVHIAAIRDITQKKKTELALIKSNKEKDQFISFMAHDLNNLISGSIQMTGLLLKDSPENDSNRDLLQLLNQNAIHANQLLMDLIDWGQASMGNSNFKAEKVPVFELAQKTASVLQTQIHNKSIKLLIEENTKQCHIKADIKMMEAIFRNLLTNALKYTPSNGTIIISSKTANRFVDICISDTGIGMEEEKAANLFEIGKVSSSPGINGEKGHRIGLLIVKEYMNIQKGNISINSKPGKGTKVSLRLPLFEP